MREKNIKATLETERLQEECEALRHQATSAEGRLSIHLASNKELKLRVEDLTINLFKLETELQVLFFTASSRILVDFR